MTKKLKTVTVGAHNPPKNVIVFQESWPVAVTDRERDILSDPSADTSPEAIAIRKRLDASR